MKSFIKSLFLMLSLGSVLTVSGCKQEKDRFNEDVISTNFKSLTGADFSTRLLRKITEQAIQYPKPDVVDVIKKQIVEDFIIQSAYERFASQNNIFVKKEDLDQSYEDLVTSFPSPESFEVSVNEAGLQISDVRESIKDRLLREKVRETVLKDYTVEVSDEDIKAYYESHSGDFDIAEQIHLKQIVVEHEEEALKVKDLLKLGKNKNFESIAKKHSLSPEKNKGGDLGWVRVSDFPAFEKAKETSNGRISPIIKSDNGYHIFKVINRRKAEKITFQKAKSKIKAILERQGQEHFVAKWLKDQSSTLEVEINNDLLSKIVVNRPSIY